MRKFFYVLIAVVIAAEIAAYIYFSKINTPSVSASLYTTADAEPDMANGKMLMSQLCTESQCRAPLYQKWAKELHQPSGFHRKIWEFVFISQALSERGLLRPGMKGVGFGVGSEPLPALFAKYGVRVLATDQGFAQAKQQGWVDTNQFMYSLDLLNKDHIVEEGQFKKLVKLREVDMNNIPEDIKGYDFTWSACSLEHLGSLENGVQFIENSLKALRPGGIAVHTTEYNLSSNEDTLTKGGTVIYRKKDIESLVKRLTSEGHEVYVNYNPGTGKLDKVVDLPPYNELIHLRLKINQYAATSIGLIIRKKDS